MRYTINIRTARWFICLIALTVPGAMCGNSLNAQIRYITVDAEAFVAAKPDQIKFKVALYGEGKTSAKAKAALEDMKIRFNAIFDVMKFKGLSKRTIGKSITDATEFGGALGGLFGAGPAKPPEEDDQVFMSEIVDLTLDGIDKLKDKELEELTVKCFDELRKLEMTTADGFKTALKNDRKWKRELIASAMDKAREKASLIAELSNGKLGKVISVEKTEFALLRTELRDMLLERLKEAGYAGGMGAMASEIKLSTRIRVKFELKDGKTNRDAKEDATK